MRISAFAIALAITSVFGFSATAQERNTSAPAAQVQAPAEKLSPGQTAMENAAKSGKYIFIYFWKGDHNKAQAGWNTLQEGIQKNAEWANSVSVNATDSAEKKLVDKFGISRAPLPLALAIAPSGVVTKPFTGNFKAEDIASARVSDCTEKCLKGLQNRKLVFVCIKKTTANGGKDDVPEGVKKFQEDKKFSAATEVVVVDADDKNESQFIKELEVDTKKTDSVTVFIAPPGAMVGKFEPSATKEQFVAKLTALQSSPCAGGKCGPGGCGGPKK
jgi:hypothetical protein